MNDIPHQGDVLKVERIRVPVIVVSKDFFNQSGEIIGCPFSRDASRSPLHIPVTVSDEAGFAHCEKITLFDLHVRGYKKIGVLPIRDMMDVTDAIQSIFDYI